MHGLEAIAAYNGWAQALTGATIVMIGLAILATVISLLPKIVALFEEEKITVSTTPSPEKSIKDRGLSVNIHDFNPLQDIRKTAKIYTDIIESLGESFLMSDLYKMFKEKNIPHPHLTIKTLREANLISPIGEGKFILKANSE